VDEDCGVSEDAAYQWVDQTPQPAMYIDALQAPPASTMYVVTTDGNPLGLAPAVRKTLAAIDATLPLDAMQTYDRDIREQTTGLMYAAAMLGVDAAIALLLAAIGIYGVMAKSGGRAAAGNWRSAGAGGAARGCAADDPAARGCSDRNRYRGGGGDGGADGAGDCEPVVGGAS
jgi:hypothetical protein